LAWFIWLNNDRLLAPVVHVPPAKAEANCRLQLVFHIATAAAWTNPTGLHETRCDSGINYKTQLS
jgi:hypothetical protein